MTANNSAELLQTLTSYIGDQQTGWSIGSFGAIAEFHQRDTDVLELDDPKNLLRVTEKGGISLDVDSLSAVHPIAYETISPRANRWAQGIVLCMPKEQSRTHQRSVLTELGQDDNALRLMDRPALIFDMGLGLENIDFCIRTQDERLIEILRANKGRSLFDPSNTAMKEILKYHPHRVAISKLGRVEVYQKIGGPDTGGVSPDGPHTHVLPKLLRTGRTHSANIPIPDDLLPVASIHPASPIYDELARNIPFCHRRFTQFQQFLRRYGLNEYTTEKSRVHRAAELKEDPSTFEVKKSRLCRRALKITLRQLNYLSELENSRFSKQWVRQMQQAFDKPTQSQQTDDEKLGHESLVGSN